MAMNSSSLKPKQQRLRASCDGCFLAKVKCSKSRPICSRCLTCGTDCKYSPSSRNGKPRADASRMSQSSVGTTSERSTSDEMPSAMYSYHTQPVSIGYGSKENAMYGLDTPWSSSMGSNDDRAGTNSTSANTSPLSMEQMPSEGTDGIISNDDCFDPSLVWNATGMELDPGFPADSHPHPLLPRSKSMNDTPQVSPPLTPWFDNHHQHLPFPAASSTGPELSHIQAYDQQLNSPSLDFPSKPSSGSCNCFTTCLQALQALHNHSGPSQTMPPFDVVLTINRKAVQGCATMLACPRCLSKSGSNTAAMLLATIMSKIMSFYRAAAQNYFGVSLSPISPTSTSLPLTFGTYRINGEESRWLEIEILWRELRKLEELFSRFQDMCGKGLESIGGAPGSCEGDELGVHIALTNYLGLSLGFTFEVLRVQEGVFMAGG